MSENPTPLDAELAWDVAYAQKPYLEVARTARQVGLLGLAAEIDLKAEVARSRIEEAARLQERSRKRLEEEQAFSRLCDEVDEDILTLQDFKITNQTLGPAVWHKLMEAVEEQDGSPIRFVEYFPGKHALVGDVEAAINILDDSAVKSILAQLAVVLAAQNPK